MNMKPVTLSIIITALLIGATIIFTGSGDTVDPGVTQNLNNVSVVDGTQIITINAKGGYTPRVTTAQAGLPTVLNVATRGTFDCSAALTIPSIGYRKTLPPSGETTIELPPQQAGARIQGICSMGMYSFTVNFN